ncbi:inositol hexakisphosphate and diphosphoinositol-pentakisphosphate kinase 2-like [Notothenia coriiceps]|uniref:diphosphoinositol-pentakisphosphate 1-kinase n=1 Tax=Notothenia coriiceps TaxID=8208 RepID=A0A6I9PLR7_9TELE|nr:PREDICTED: inositol hexakisphosphate and diphosphoinositol-pentakisphosphate kinase 2-like [Notothenia coriiceps]
MVKSANMNGLLDSDSDSLTDCQQKVKARLHEIMQRSQEFTEDDYLKLAPTSSPSLVNSMKIIQNPVKTCDKVYALIQSLNSQIRKRLEDPKSADLQLYHSETLELMLQRWSKLERDFRMKNGRYDISKIPDIYDCIKYDSQHNASLGLEDTLELFRLSRALADIVIPQVNEDQTQLCSSPQGLSGHFITSSWCFYQFRIRQSSMRKQTQNGKNHVISSK